MQSDSYRGLYNDRFFPLTLRFLYDAAALSPPSPPSPFLLLCYPNMDTSGSIYISTPETDIRKMQLLLLGDALASVSAEGIFEQYHDPYPRTNIRKTTKDYAMLPTPSILALVNTFGCYPTHTVRKPSCVICGSASQACKACDFPTCCVSDGY